MSWRLLISTKTVAYFSACYFNLSLVIQNEGQTHTCTENPKSICSSFRQAAVRFGDLSIYSELRSLNFDKSCANTHF